MKYLHIVWDFNGTIIDDVEIGILSVNPLLKARGLAEIESVDSYKELFDFPIIDYYRALGFDFDSEPYEKIAVEWIDNYKSQSKRAGLVDGVADVLEYATDHGIGNMILSASEKEMLINKLKELKIADKFECFLALDNIYAHSKLDIAKEYFKDKNKGNYLMVGDTVHDAEVAKAVGIDAVLVACGHQSYERLSGTGLRVFETMNDFLCYLKNVTEA